MEENYIYLGSSEDVLFFSHFSPKGLVETSHHIYNCLIHEGFIIDPQPIVIIYEIGLDSIFVTIIQHINRNRELKFDKNNLAEQLVKLFSIDRQVFDFGIKYDGQKYFIYDNLSIPAQDFCLPKESYVTIEDIAYILTFNSIT